MYKKVCSICKRKFWANRKWAAYCQLQCKNTAARQRLSLKLKRKCKCGKKFGASDTRQKYCGVACSLKFSKPTRNVNCSDCGRLFKHIGRGRRYRCEYCQKTNQAARTHSHAVKTGKIKNPGCGSGGNQHGSNNHGWKGGVRRSYKGSYRTNCFSLWGMRCVVCRATKKIHVHHVDGNIKNPVVGNLIPLCYSCHKLVHKQRHKTVAQYVAALEKIWPNCRRKIAEKTGNPGSGQSEVKAARRKKREPAATTRS